MSRRKWSGRMGRIQAKEFLVNERNGGTNERRMVTTIDKEAIDVPAILARNLLEDGSDTRAIRTARRPEFIAVLRYEDISLRMKGHTPSPSPLFSNLPLPVTPNIWYSFPIPIGSTSLCAAWRISRPRFCLCAAFRSLDNRMSNPISRRKSFCGIGPCVVAALPSDENHSPLHCLHAPAPFMASIK